MSWWDGDPGSKREAEYADRMRKEQEDMDALRTEIYQRRHPGKTRRRSWDTDAFYVHSPGTQHLNEFEDHMEDELWDLRQIVATKEDLKGLATVEDLRYVIKLMSDTIDQWGDHSDDQRKRIEELKKEVEYWKEMAVGRKEPEQGKNTSDKGNLRLVSR